MGKETDVSLSPGVFQGPMSFKEVNRRQCIRLNGLGRYVSIGDG
jgi:hypothetical protein